ncbi:MAG TPA: hypothetical protein VE736_06935 [Gaiellaceae bacterium]|nr:hypothetical protein [Gaiellaceae bacterium]
MTELERRAEEFVAPYWNAGHLLNTRDWLVRLEPNAPEALRVAAVVHDCERMFPGGPQADPNAPHDDEAYLRAHSERSARFAGNWLRRTGADPALVDEVERLVRLHETGGTPAADVLQAADSISFLDVNDGVVLRWLADGRATREQARGKLDYMLERIRIERARELALPLYERSVARLEAA